jgi:hypothetical protein
MSVPRTREPQKIPVSQIARGLSFLVILMFMQSNYPSAPKDSSIVGAQNGPRAGLEDSQRVSGLLYCVSPICGICNEVSP